MNATAVRIFIIFFEFSMIIPREGCERLFVYLSVRPHISETTWPNFT